MPSKYPEPKDDREAIARLCCMADDLEASITAAARTLAELRVELGKLLHAKVMQNTEPRQRADSTLSE